MRIRTRLKAVSWIAGGMAILVMALCAYNYAQLKQAGARQELAREMAETAQKRTALRDEYLLHHDERPLEQWRQQTEKLESLIKQAQTAFVPPRQALVLRQASLSLDRTKTAFARLRENLDGMVKGKIDTWHGQAIEDRIISRLIIDAQSLITELYTLQRIADREYAGRLARSIAAILLSMLLLASFTFVFLMMTSRGIAAPLLRLKEGIEVIATGNLDHRVNTESNDEIGDLAQAFNRMTGSLKTIIISRDDLAREVENRTRAEETLRESERKFRETVTNLDEGYYSVTMDGVLLEHNRAFNRILGFEHTEDLRGVQLPDFWRNPDKRREYVRTLAAGGSISNYQIDAKTKTGEEITVLASAHVVKDKDNRPLRIEGIFLDITKRQRAEIQVRYQANLLANVSDAILSTDTQFNIQYWNTAAEKQYGWTSAEVMGRHFRKFIKPHYISDSRRTVIKKITQEGYWHGELLHNRRDGTLFPVLVTISTVRNAEGQIIGHVAINRDITERKRAEYQLRALTARQEAILDAVPDIIMEVDTRKVYTWANKAGLGFFGGDVIGREAAFYFEGEQETYRAVQPIFNGSGEVIYVESWQRRKDGCKRLLAWWCRVLKDDRGRVTGALSSARDITDRHEAEEELRQKNAEMERFTYTISHDLKAPLVTIKTFLEYLEQDRQKADAVRIEKDMCYLRLAADKMGKMLDELLKMSRIGRIVNPPVRATFRDLVEDALAAVAGIIAERGVKVTVSDEPLILFGDRPRLVEIWQNLIDNAAKFMGDQASPRIDIGLEPAGGETAFFVRDNGIGIDPRHQGKIFALFEQLNPTVGGTGIGLALVKRIVELYGGVIGVESLGEGHGASFRFTLPNAILIQREGDSS